MDGSLAGFQRSSVSEEVGAIFPQDRLIKPMTAQSDGDKNFISIPKIQNVQNQFEIFLKDSTA